MKMKQQVLSSSGLTTLRFACLILSIGLFAPNPATAQEDPGMREWNNKIRREKFDLLLPAIMRERNVDMWIHVMRVRNSDPFGAEELGSTSGVFVFTDRGGDRIERAVLGRRWGATQRERGSQSTTVEDSGAYDIIAPPIRVQEPVGGPMSEYDYRFKGLREFVLERNPKRIALNFKKDLGPWVTYNDFGGAIDGLSYTDYLLLTEEIGDEFADRIVSSEYVVMDYITRKVPSEIEQLKKIRQDQIARIKSAFDAVVPGVTKSRGSGVTVLRRMRTGQSQRGRSDGWEDSVIVGGDILASPSTGLYAYVLREGETEPPPGVQRLWSDYQTVDRILAKNIKAGLTPREIIRNYTRDFEEAGIIVRENMIHMVNPKNDFNVFSAGYDPDKTHLAIDCHGMMKGARNRPNENYLGPRVGSLGPDWSKTLTLQPNHHFVLEYFFYSPSPAEEGMDQYLLFWDHEAVLATKDGVEYLSPPQKELILVK